MPRRICDLVRRSPHVRRVTDEPSAAIVIAINADERRALEFARTASCGGGASTPTLDEFARSVLLAAVAERAAPRLAPPSPSLPTRLPDHLAAIERACIYAALDRANGNQTRAAAMLGLTRRALISRMEKHGLRRADVR